MTRSISRALVSIVLTAAGAALLAYGPAWAETGNLPPDLLEKFTGEQAVGTDELLMVDLYSPFCSVCHMMEPHLDHLRRLTQGRVRYLRLDVSQSENEKYMAAFDVKGTPGYVLFDAAGKPVYKMSELINPLVLQKQVLKRIDGLEKVALPDSLVSEDAREADLRLLAFGGKDCKPCKTGDGYLQGYELAQQGDELAVIRLDNRQDDVKKLLSKLRISSVPAYVVTDEDNRELFRFEGSLENPARAKVLWDILKGLADDGL